MSTAILNIEVKADDVSAAEKKLDGLTAASSRAEKSAAGLSSAASSLTNTLGAMGVAIGALGLIKLADSWSDLNSRVRLASGSLEAGTEVMERLSDMARRTYSDLNQTTESYLNNATALRELGYTTNETLDFTEALNNAFVVSGAKAQRAESVMNALGKAMASGKLSGLELNTVIQTGGRVAELLAQELGTTVAGLRDFGAAGKITGDLIYKTMTKNLETLKEEAESMPATISDAFTLIRNAVLQNVGVFDQAGKVSETFASSLIVVADNMDVVTKAGIGLASVGLAKYLSGATASLGAYASAQVQAIQIERAAIVEKSLSTQAELALAAARLKSAEAAMATHRANGLVTASTSALNRELLASRVAYSAASLGAATASTAVAGIGTASTITSIAVSGLNTALSLVGGPVGLAILAVGAGFYTLSQRAQEAEDRAARYAEAIKIAGENSDVASGGIQAAAEKLFQLAAAATEAEREVAKQDAFERQAAAIEALRVATIVAIKTNGQFINNQRELGNILVNADKKFRDGKISVEEYIKEVDRITKLDPSLAKPIATLIGFARVVAGTTGEVNALSSAIANIGGGGGKGSRLNKDNILSARMEAAEFQMKEMIAFEKRFGDIQAKLQSGGFGKPEKESKGGGKGGSGGGTSEADRIAEDMASRLDALKSGLQGEMEAKIEAYAKDMETLKWYLDNKKMTEEEYEIFKDQLQEKAFERGLTEEERLTAEYERQLLMLQQFLDAKKISEEEYLAWKAEVTAQHEEQMSQLRLTQYADALSATGDLMGAMASAIGSGNDKMLKAQKIFGAASALVSTYIGAAKALELGFPQNLAAMAAVLAKGMSLVAAIRSGSKSSGSGGGSSGTTQAAAPQQNAPMRQMARIDVHGEVFNREQVIGLISKINDVQKDGHVISWQGA